MLRALVCSAFLWSTTLGQVQAPAREVPTGLALNLAGVEDWGTEHPFVDLFRTARTWVPQAEGRGWGQGSPLDLDEAGWPKSLAPGQYCTTLMLTNGGHRPGDFVCEWRGTGRIEIKGDARVVRRDDRSIEFTVGEQGILLDVREVSPRDPIRNIRVVPSARRKDTPTFDEAFLARCKQFRALRFMDWMDTNNSEIRDWDDRPRLADAVQTRRGVALELMIELCNTAGVSPWFCMPHRATDDHVRSFASEVATHLAPNLKVYVEYSNEVWNASFAQARFAREQGKALSLADDAFLAQLRFHSRRSVEVFRIWEREFKGTKRLVRVLAAQAATPWTSEQVVTFEKAYESADALAIAPYFGPVVGTPEEARLLLAGGLDEVFRRARASIEANAGRLGEHARIAAKHGLALIAYEGGQHLVGVGALVNDDKLTELLVSANRDPRMHDLYLADQESWRLAGGRLFALFSSVGKPSKYGSWGLLESTVQDVATAPKYRAVLELLAKYPKGW